jgi:hypothetical protein
MIYPLEIKLKEEPEGISVWFKINPCRRWILREISDMWDQLEAPLDKGEKEAPANTIGKMSDGIGGRGK